MNKFYKELLTELSVLTVIVVIVSLLFDFSSLPAGVGKYFAYFSIGLIPVLAIEFYKYNKMSERVDTTTFFMVLILKTSFVLSLSRIILLFTIGKL